MQTIDGRDFLRYYKNTEQCSSILCYSFYAGVRTLRQLWRRREIRHEAVTIRIYHMNLLNIFRSSRATVRLFRKANMNDFYSSQRWKRKREAILRRDGYMCQRCKRYGRQRQAQTVHHIKHYDEYPELALTDSNLISLCNDCHNAEHPEKAAEANKGRRARYY